MPFLKSTKTRKNVWETLALWERVFFQTPAKTFWKRWLLQVVIFQRFWKRFGNVQNVFSCTLAFGQKKTYWKRWKNAGDVFEGGRGGRKRKKNVMETPGTFSRGRRPGLFWKRPGRFKNALGVLKTLWAFLFKGLPKTRRTFWKRPAVSRNVA